MENNSNNQQHPFSDTFVLDTEAAVAGDTSGVQAGVACVLERIAQVSLGWQVPISDAEGIVCIFVHRDDVGCPGDPLPTWTDKRPRLEDVITAIERLHHHFLPLRPGYAPILLTDIERDEDIVLDDGEEPAR